MNHASHLHRNDATRQGTAIDDDGVGVGEQGMLAIDPVCGMKVKRGAAAHGSARGRRI